MVDVVNSLTRGQMLTTGADNIELRGIPDGSNG